jgi:6-phosphogluconate dehydrogenase
VIIDGGNSYFADTDRRAEALEAKGINYLGIGVSGGEKGARFGPSLMPGGQKEAYEKVKPIFEAAAAKVNGEPCVTYLGPKSAGNYVKMVHNGIEYGLMQLISEAYDLMKRGLGLGNDQLHQTFARWNHGELQSFLIEITASIFAQKDDRIEGILVDSILDKAKQKGTGKWTSQHAFDLGIPLSVIDTAVTMRYLSALKEERVKAAEKFPARENSFSGDQEKFIQQLENALYFGFVTAYAQGMALLKAASDEMNYNLNLSDVARIWRGGCIIRSALLEPIRTAYSKQPALPNLLMDDYFSKEISTREADTRTVIKFAVENGIPAATLMASLAYFDAYRSKRLPSNLIQAQRDNFGAHTYERIDVEGIFHTQWNG